MTLDPAGDIRETRRRQLASLDARCVDPISRRRFLELMGASLALAGVTGCGSPPREQIVPYVRPPEEVIPGRPLFYATATTLGGYAAGTLVESHLGRPTKVEGNPDHPASLGATDAFAQASVLTLYDPARSQTVLANGAIRSWPELLARILEAVASQRSAEGAGIRFLSGAVTSPTLADQMRAILQQLPRARWHHYEPVARDYAAAGARIAFGRDVAVRYRLDAADVLLVLDGDPLSLAPGHVRYIADFASRRRVRAGQPTMSRVYAVESTPSILGSVADNRLPLAAGQIAALANAVAVALGIDVGPAEAALPPGVPAGWLSALVGDLQRRRGSSLVIVGDAQPPAVHAVAHAINHALGNGGKTVEYTEPIEVTPRDHFGSLRELTDDMAAGRVEMLMILGGNPAYTAPADVPFGASLARVPFSIHLSDVENETSALAQWHVPELHPLETWTDARAFDGTVTIMQPLIAPLHDGKSVHELVAAFTDLPERSSHEIVKSFWRTQRRDGDFESFWRTSLHDGLVAGSALPAIAAAPQAGWASRLPRPAPSGAPSDALELVFRPDHSVYDGRFASNGWLQELPKPFTKLTWENAALVSPTLARRLGVGNGDVVELHYRGGLLRAPVWLLPGQAENSVTVTLGYGRTRGAGAANGAGFNAYLLRTSDAPWFGSGLELRRTGETVRLASTQGHFEMAGRPIVRSATLDEFQANPEFVRAASSETAGSLYPEFAYQGNAWGMAIDLSACVGCNACVVACEAENNSPIVGKQEVLRDREMQWLRIDTYFEGDAINPRIYHQPVPCMHCEKAPCELVCPVGATVHSAEGLNDMIYNRCVGTRYCSNNCPYKVRRFNFLQYSDYGNNTLRLLHNPDVTVRSRGVMEKCTYCVQRIRSAEIQADKEGRPIRDGEIVTACQAACPARAITFGNINDLKSEVAALKGEPHNYLLLDELKTQPRTSYLGAVRNPNPAIGPG